MSIYYMAMDFSNDDNDNSKAHNHDTATMMINYVVVLCATTENHQHD